MTLSSLFLGQILDVRGVGSGVRKVLTDESIMKRVICGWQCCRDIQYTCCTAAETTGGLKSSRQGCISCNFSSRSLFHLLRKDSWGKASLCDQSWSCTDLPDVSLRDTFPTFLPLKSAALTTPDEFRLNKRPLIPPEQLCSWGGFGYLKPQTTNKCCVKENCMMCYSNIN